MKRVFNFILAGILTLPVCVASQTLPAMPPSGYFDVVPANPKGTVENITYGSGYKARVYTPPGYSKNGRYACMYLLHGMGGSEASWHDNDLYAHLQLDNLIAQGKVTPFIMVFTRNDMNNWDFETILIQTLIPYIEKNYSVSTDPNNRALGGLSMGGMQTLNIGLKNLDKFPYLMPSSSAPGVKPNTELFPNDGALAKEKLKVMLLTCGSADGLITNNTRIRDYCNSNTIPNVYEWIVQGGGHDRTVWRPSFWNFAQMADQKGFTKVGGTVVREYDNRNFSIVAAAEHAGVFDLRGRFMKYRTVPNTFHLINGCAPGLYVIRWQNGNQNYTKKHSVNVDYNHLR